MKEVKIRRALSVIAILIAIIGALSLQSCGIQHHRNHSGNSIYTPSDSVYIVHVVQDYYNPELITPNDVMKYQEELKLQRLVDDFMANTSMDVIQSVMFVLNKKGIATTPINLYKEYLRGKDIYPELSAYRREQADITLNDPLPEDSL